MTDFPHPPKKTASLCRPTACNAHARPCRPLVFDRNTANCWSYRRPPRRLADHRVRSNPGGHARLEAHPQAAISLPNFGSRNGATELAGLFGPALKQALKDKGPSP